MKYYIYDPQKKNHHLYKDLIISNKLFFLSKISTCKNLNVIFIASKVADLYTYSNLKKNNNVILVIENRFLIEKIIFAKNIVFYRLSDFLEKNFN